MSLPQPQLHSHSSRRLRLRPPATSGAAMLIILLILVVAGGAGGWYYWKQRNKETISYLTTPIRRGDLIQSVSATGTLNPVINVQVGSQISGIVQSLHADFNSPVTAGQVVAQIDPGTYEATVKQAEGELANAKAALELARLNEERARELHNRKASPKSSLDQAVASLRQAEAQVLIREGSLQRARVDLERCTIYSPVDGIVISRDVDVGQTVAASLSAPIIFTIANDLAKMQINTAVAEADVGDVREGQDVEFTVDAYPTRTFKGKVMQVRNAPITVDNVVTYDAIIAVNNDDLKLKPGMTASTSIITARQDDALLITAAALRFKLPEELDTNPPEPEAPQPSEGTAVVPPEETPTATPTPAKANANASANEVAAQLQASARGEGRAAGGRAYRSGGGKGGSGGGGRARGNRSKRDVYVLRDNRPQRVTIRTGISDGITTAVLDGLKEGDEMITSVIGYQKAAAGGSGSSPNPFTGAGMRRRF